MEKLEKHIKDKLEERKIAPSPKAWKSIAGQIGTSTTSRKEGKYWYAIAAGFIGLLLASIFFFASDKSEVTIQVVDGNDPKLEKESSTPFAIDSTPNGSKTSTVVGIKKEDLIFDNQIKENTGHTSASLKKKELVAKQSIQDSFAQESDPLIAQKVNEVFAKVTLLEHVNSEVSDAEVDSLLRAAQREVLSEQLFTAEGTVDAMALLTEVEDELDATFRDQIFEALKEGYVKLRTAVADRNN